MAKNNQVNITLKAKDQASSKFKKIWKNAWGLWSRLKWLWWPLKAIWIWAAAAWAALWVVWVKMFNMADSLETTIWKSKIVFWEYFDEMDKFAQETWKAMWLSRVEFLKTAAWIQDLLIPMWFTREEAAKNTQEMMWLSWALSEWSAGQYTAAEVWNILAKAMLWEREQLKSLWISITEADVQQRLLENWTKNLTWAELAQAKAMATQQLIMEKSTDAQKAYADWADSLTRKKAEMKATMQNLYETISWALLPAFHSVIEVLQPIIEKVAESITLWFQNKENVEKLTAVFKTIITVFWFLFEAIWKAIWFLTKMWEMLWFVAFKVVEFFWVMKDKFTRLKELVIWIWTSISQSTINVWNWIKNWVIWLVDSLVSAVTSKFTAMIDKVKAIYNTIKGWLWSIFWAEQKAQASASRVRSIAWSTQTWAWTTLSWARASWWPVMWWNSYLVWENWPEIFTPASSWSISNNSSSQSINITFNWNLWNEWDRRNMIEEIKMALSRDMQYASYWIN